MKVSEQFNRVFYLIDSEEKLSMTYLYEAMGKSKETIQTGFKNKVP